MKNNPNNRTYWDMRFNSRDWEDRGGRCQTVVQMRTIIPEIRLSQDFSGMIMDFGCALGDGIPMLHAAFPNAKLIGVDHSEAAIKKCEQCYGALADFLCSDGSDLPQVDIIVSSHVMEHVTDDRTLAMRLLKSCSELYIAVPYREPPGFHEEHVNTYDESYYRSVAGYEDCVVVRTYPLTLRRMAVELYIYYLKNVPRFLLRRKRHFPEYQVVFRFIAEKK